MSTIIPGAPGAGSKPPVSGQGVITVSDWFQEYGGNGQVAKKASLQVGTSWTDAVSVTGEGVLAGFMVNGNNTTWQLTRVLIDGSEVAQFRTYNSNAAFIPLNAQNLPFSESFQIQVKSESGTNWSYCGYSYYLTA